MTGKSGNGQSRKKIDKRVLIAFACVAFLTFIAVAAFLSSYTGRANLCRQTKICINVDYDNLHRLRLPVFPAQ